MIHIEATCDKCDKVFNVKFKEKKHPKKVIETYFRCTHCKHHYTCFVTDEKVRQMQKDIKTEGSPFIRSAKQREINSRMKKLKERITK